MMTRIVFYICKCVPARCPSPLDCCPALTQFLLGAWF